MILKDRADAWRGRFARFVLAACALTFVVIVSSAFMRHAQAGLGCADWPACYARTTDTRSIAPPGVYFARIGHRLAATGVLLGIAGALFCGWSQREAWSRERALALSALGCAMALAAIGVATPDAKQPAVPLANLVGGFVLFALLAVAWSTARNVPAAPLRARRLATFALVALFAQAAFGGLIGTQFASLACPTLACDDVAWRTFVDGAAWNPWRVPDISAGRTVSPPGAAGLHVVHRVLGALVVLLATTAALAVRRVRPRAAAAIFVLTAITAALGAGAVSARPSLAAVVLHNASSALLVATLATLLGSRSRAVRDPQRQ